MRGFPWLSPFGLSRRTSVAVLIVIRPGVKINAVKSDALCADGNYRDVRSHFVVEAVLVHAEISRRVAQPDEARQECRWRIVLRKHRRLQFRVQSSLTSVSGDIMIETATEDRFRNRGRSGTYRLSSSKERPSSYASGTLERFGLSSRSRDHGAMNRGECTSRLLSQD